MVAKANAKSGGVAKGPGAFLFVDDDERVVRFRLGQGRVSIGRDQGNDIWIEHPDVPQHALVIVRRDGLDVMKVYEGASVQLNDVAVTRMHRLYGGDRIHVADREFLYARDDDVPDFALALTIRNAREPVRAVILRQARIRLGRRDADITLNDPSVSDRHVGIEAYGTDVLFASDLGSSMGTQVDGRSIDSRVRLKNGAKLQVGRVQITVHLMDADAHGLLALPEVARARPKQIDTPIGARTYDLETTKPTKPTRPSARTKRASSRQQALVQEPLQLDDEDIADDLGAEIDGDAAPPPPTVIGSLAQIARAQADEAPKRSRKRPRPGAARSGSWRPSTPAKDRTAPPPPAQPLAPPRRPKRRVSGPSVRVSPEVFERGRQATGEVDGPPRPRRQDPVRKYGAGRVSTTDKEAVRPATRKQLLHDKLTDVLDTNNVRDLVGERYVAAYESAEPMSPERNERYRPSRPGGARLLTDQKLVPRGDSAPLRDPFGVHQQLTQSGDPRSARNIKLTNVLDVNAERPRLSREVHALDPDAMPEQLRDASPRSKPRGRGPIDSASRRNPRDEIDSGRRIEPDED